MPSKKKNATVTSAPPITTEEPGPPEPEPVPPLEVLYCAVCSFPPEYCEFGSSLTRCKEWLKENNADLYQRYYSDDALVSKIGTLSMKAQEQLEKDTAKKELKAEQKADAALKKKMASKITIKRIERNKRKHITAIHGLEAFNVDLKKAAKSLASKFATGASVTKNAQGQEEIVVQGDVGDDFLEMIEEEVGLFKGIPSDNVHFVEEKKKG